MRYSIFDNISRTERERVIREWIFSERDRAIISRRLLDGVTYETLAGELDMSVRQIKRIVARCEAQLYKHI